VGTGAPKQFKVSKDKETGMGWVPVSGFRHSFASEPPGGMGQRRFDGISFERKKLHEGGPTSTIMTPALTNP